MYNIKFEYRDAYTGEGWSKQECVLWGRTEHEAVAKCKELYGLGVDCDYRITSIEKVQ